mgnify:CR=1 FL=1
MTVFALRMAGWSNAVSRRHGEVARKMWAGLWPEKKIEDVPIVSITNGVHLLSYLSPRMREILDIYLGLHWERDADPERWKKVTGSPLLQAYGLTETSPAATINPLSLKEFNGSIGLPISSTEVSIRDDDGKEVPLDQVGEICIRGPQVMAGYWQRPDETAKVMYADGFLRTGDMGYIDHLGYVYLVDRKKDMILVSGFNVYPNEVEEAVAMHEGVGDVAAIGVADENSGEVVKIFVVRKDPNLTADEIIAHCRKHLTGYKVPKQVEFRADLPRTNVGKILRRALKEGG